MTTRRKQDIPADVDVEQQLIGSIILRPDVLDDLATTLQARDFHDPAYGTMYGAMLDMHAAGKQVDLSLLRNRLHAAGKLEAVGGMAAIAAAFQSVPNAAHGRYYADIVREKSIRRRLMDAGNVIIEAARNEATPVDDALAQAEQAVLGVAHARSVTDRVSGANEAMKRFLDTFEARRTGKIQPGLPTGIGRLDALIGGLRPSQLIIIGARPSMGKSSLAQTIAENVAIGQRKPVLLVNLETSEADLSDRLAASVGRVDLRRITAGTTAAAETERVLDAARMIAASPLVIDEGPDRTVRQIAALARRTKRKTGLSLVLIDYVQLITPDNPRDPRQEQVAKITRACKLLAKELDVPVVLLAQINRQSADTNEPPKLHHLRESGALEQDADVALLIHRPEHKPDGDAGERAQVIVAKQKNGPKGEVDVMFFGPYVRFEQAAPQRLEKQEPQRFKVFDEFNADGKAKAAGEDF